MTTSSTPLRHRSLLLTLVLAAGAVLLLAPPAAAATVTDTIDGITYAADDTDVAAGATVTLYDPAGPMGLDPVIPATVDLGGTTYAVTNIGYQAFYEMALTSVSIPNSVTNIGISAFTNNAMTSVTLPSNLSTVGQGAFANNALTSLTIPASLTAIGFTVFQGNQLTSVTFPNTLTSINQGAFAYNHQLTSVTFPSSVTFIGAAAFDETTALTTVIFEGDAPTIIPANNPPGTPAGSFGPATGKTLYYSSTASGFTSPTWQDYSTAELAAPVITSGTFPAADQFVPFSYTLTATGSPAPTLSMTGLPAGLSFDPATGVLSGSPDVPGTFSVTMTASNGVSPDAVVTQDLQVTAGIFITSAPPPGGAVGTPYNYTFTGTGPGTLAWSVESTTPLPPGLTLGTASGVISGTPTTAGTYNVRIWLANGGVSPAVFVNYTIVITAQTYTVSFESNGGSAVAEQTVNDGDPATEPTAPTRTDHTFTGWFTDPALTSLYDFSTPVNADLTLYGGWEENAAGPTEPVGSIQQMPTTGAEISLGSVLASVLALVGGSALLLLSRRRNA